MQVQVVNRRAMARYGRFWDALVRVSEVVIEARRTAEQLGSMRGSERGLAAPSGSELRTAVKNVERSLGVLSKSAQRWEAELKSREWRV